MMSAWLYWILATFKDATATIHKLAQIFAQLTAKSLAYQFLEEVTKFTNAWKNNANAAILQFKAQPVVTLKDKKKRDSKDKQRKRKKRERREKREKKKKEKIKNLKMKKRK